MTEFFTCWKKEVLLKVVLTIAISMYGNRLCAQAFHNATTVFIPEGMQVSVDATISNTGFLQNNGILSVTGNWGNTGIYQGTGSVDMNGKDQLIDNNKQPIAHLIIDGGGIKSIHEKLIIHDQIDFNNGIVLVEDSDTLTLLDNVTIGNSSSSSYVDGALTSIGTGYKFFPIGKNGKYHPAELTEITGLTPTVEMEVMENLPSVGTALPTTLYTDIYWSRKTIDGSFTGSPVSLAYAISDTVDISRLVIAEGESWAAIFSVIDCATQPGSDIISSKEPITAQYLAVGTLVHAPPKPYYLSTTLSPHATNPDNRAVKLFGDNMTDTNFYFQVFDRWGLSVFESQSLTTMQTDGWDGRHHGTPLSSGVYPYNLKYSDASGKTVEHTGFITIIN